MSDKPELSEGLKKLVIVMLDEFASYRASRGCNDTSKKWLDLLSDEDKKLITESQPRWNGGSDPDDAELLERYPDYFIGYDWIVCGIVGMLLGDSFGLPYHRDVESVQNEARKRDELFEELAREAGK